MDLLELNERIAAIARDAGIDTTAEGVDETIDDITHYVANKLGI